MKTLFEELMELTKGSDIGFYYSDQINQAGTPVRIFGYYTASYSDWLKPSALESRGITFSMKDREDPRVLCRPMKKFFNLNENPFTTNLDLTQVETLMDKMDGSMVSFYWDGQVLSKTKMSCWSEQAVEALDLLKSQPDLYQQVENLVKQGITLNFEYVSPTNRVVVFYGSKDLVYLNARDNQSGEYLDLPQLDRWSVHKSRVEDPDTFVQTVLKTPGIEGYVGILRDGTWFKIKTEWYSALHRLKDRASNPARLLECMALDAYDDLYSLAGSPEEKSYLDKALKVYRDFLQYGLDKIRAAWEANQHGTRKEYAIQGQRIFGVTKDSKPITDGGDLDRLEIPFLFGIYMSLYGSEFDRIGVLEALKANFMKYPEKFVGLLES